jgi:hypothetical protein
LRPDGPPATPAGTGHSNGAERGGSWGPLTSLLAILGLTGPTLPALGLAPTVVTTGGAVAAAMAFGLFGRRRREDGSDEELAAEAGTAFAVLPLVAEGTPALPVAVAYPIEEAAADAASRIGEVERIEALIPRWRRPSLLHARKTDPVRDDTPAPPLTFDRGLIGALDRSERRLIRYRLVRLLDSPDELRGADIGYLDQGDEVQLLEKSGAYWLVLCPDGQQGWLHKMTLGDVIEPHRDGDSVGPVATMPIEAESWTMGDAGAHDVFGAYLEARRREA